jgi:hypothetical protein
MRVATIGSARWPKGRGPRSSMPGLLIPSGHSKNVWRSRPIGKRP